MPVEQIWPLMAFIIVMTGTPGPNNFMLMTSGANFGFRRSVPHILGITVGCQVLLVAMALGLGSLFVLWPPAEIVLRILCVVILVYLAWLLVRPGGGNSSARKRARPLKFIEAALFQWVNPKAWMMTIAAVATYTQPGNMVTGVAIIALLFALLGIPLIATWNLFGVSLQRWLDNPVRARNFNWLMAILLLASLYPIIIDF